MFKSDSNEDTLIQLLLKRQAELNSLLELTQAINRNSSAQVLFEMLELIMKVHLKVGRMRLLVEDTDRFYCAARFGGTIENSKAMRQLCNALKKINRIEALDDRYAEVAPGYSFFVPVLQENKLKAFIVIGDFNVATELVHNDLTFMQTLINVIVVALDNKKLFVERLEKELLQRDIALAGELQSMLVPLQLVKDNNIQVSSMYLPNQDIGGDYFDFIRISEHEFIWCIADVSGKGIAAALLMANLQASLRAWVSVEDNLATIVSKLNKIIVNTTNGERFVTFFLAKFNEHTRELSYINAGHNPPVLVMDGVCSLLREGTTIIGALDDLPFIRMKTQILSAGSLIFNYTDGLIESGNENAFVSDDDLTEILLSLCDLPIDELNRNVLKRIQQSYRAKMNSDDITMLSIKIN